MSIRHSVHDCKSVRLGPPYALKRGDGTTFASRDLTIMDVFGAAMRITLFGDTTESVSTAEECERYAQPDPGPDRCGACGQDGISILSHSCPVDPLAEIVAEADAHVEGGADLAAAVRAAEAHVEGGKVVYTDTDGIVYREV